MRMTWELRFVLWQVAAFLVVTGWAWWRLGHPRPGSAFGLRFSDLEGNEAAWRDLHARVGRLAFFLGLWLSVPLPSIVDTLVIQVLPVVFGSFIGVGVIRWRQARRRLGA